MKKAILFLNFMFLLISLGNSQNAVIKNNYVTAYRGDTIEVNMNSNNYDPDEGEVLKIKSYSVSGNYTNYSSKTDSTIKFSINFTNKGTFKIYCIINEVRNNIVLATYKDTLFVTNSDIYWHDTLTINNIRPLFCANGDMFNKGKAFNFEQFFEAPKFSNTMCHFACYLIIAGFDQNNDLKLSKNNYGNFYENFYVGPIANNYKSKNYIKKYTRLWNIEKKDVDYHINNWNKPNYTPSKSILDWPANGDTTNGEAFLIAPFQDLNNNQIYEPYLGEYPLIKGDECIYLIFNDNSNLFPNFNTSAVNVEIRTMIYAYNSPNIKHIDNTVFVEYEIINCSNNNYHNFQVGLFDDIDVGQPGDDYIGCDTNLNLAYGYNATNNDLSYYSYGYKDYPPAIGLLLLNNKMNSFIRGFTNSNSVNNMGFYNYLQGNNANGTNIYYGGDGIYGNPNVSNIIVKYHFFGDPNDTTQWSEVSAKTTPDDRNIYISSPPNNFAPNEKIKFDIAFIFAQDSSLNHLQNVGLLKQYAQSIKDFYQVIGKEEFTKPNNNIKIYPNPTLDKFYFSNVNDNEMFNIAIYNLSGQLLSYKKDIKSFIPIDISHLEKGVYLINFSNNKNSFTTKLIKN